MSSRRTVLVTGAAGFIGSELSLRLLQQGDRVFGLDNMNAYYDIGLKQDRLKRLEPFKDFQFCRMNLHDSPAVEALFKNASFDVVVNLAAQPGVRYSIINPLAYAETNLIGFLNVLEGCRHSGVKHLVFASSSSVYGANTSMPFSVHQNVDHPVSLYAATKKANELMAHSYAHLYRLPCTGLRFFTVYGPWGRPDMAPFLFAKAILEGKPIQVFNHGRMQRDFTYIDDIVEGVVHVMGTPPEPDPSWNGEKPDPGTSNAPYRLYNIGNNQPVELMEFIATLEACLGKEAQMVMLPMQPGDVPATYADISELSRDFGFYPKTTIQDGVRCFVEWYLSYYR